MLMPSLCPFFYSRSILMSTQVTRKNGVFYYTLLIHKNNSAKQSSFATNRKEVSCHRRKLIQIECRGETPLHQRPKRGEFLTPRPASTFHCISTNKIDSKNHRERNSYSSPSSRFSLCNLSISVDIRIIIQW